MRLTAAVSREGKVYIARCLEVEVTSQGETIEEALNNLREALELYFEDKDTLPDTLPLAPIIAPVEIEISNDGNGNADYTGHLLL